jgi:hypothetical protein
MQESVTDYWTKYWFKYTLEKHQQNRNDRNKRQKFKNWYDFWGSDRFNLVLVWAENFFENFEKIENSILRDLIDSSKMILNLVECNKKIWYTVWMSSITFITAYNLSTRGLYQWLTIHKYIFWNAINFK